VDFRILGPLEVTGDDGCPVHLPAGRARIVLALLCARAGHIVSSDSLIDAAWNGAPPATAATQVQGFVSALRRAFGPEQRDLIATDRDGYAIRADTDLTRFRALVQQQDLSCFQQALALWRGRPFGGLDCIELDAAADAIEQEYVAVLEQYAGLKVGAGDFAGLTGSLPEWVSRHPLREGLRAPLIQALARTGRQADAIAVYHDLRRLLADELGVDPSPELQDLYQRILTGDRDTMQSSPPAVPSTGQSVVRPAQVPAAAADFTGRAMEVKELREALVPRTGGPPPVAIAAVAIAVVTGTGGIGKSALAAHVAHLMRDEFPDGQLYVNLAGASREPAAPRDVIARLLRDLGVPAEDVPAATDEREARYRSVLAGKRVLLVLDDAHDAAQVRSLLPGTDGCAVLITSRARLADLPGVRRFDLAELTEQDAHDLFARIVGDRRATAEPTATTAILAACGGLPLAIRIAAARLASRPGWTIESVAAKLAAEHHRLAELQIGDLAVRASFQLSYDGLPDAAASAFRLLGLAPPGVLSLASVAALLGRTVTEAEETLDTLVDAHVLEAPAPGQYRLHDLLRLFAAELTVTKMTEQDRQEAFDRLLIWYHYALRYAVEFNSEGFPLARADAGQGLPAFRSYAEAQEWCEREHQSLVSVVGSAAARGRHEMVVGMARLISMYAHLVGSLRGHLAIQRTALDSARQIGDLRGEAWILSSLGDVLMLSSEVPQAIECFERELSIRQDVSSKGGIASAHNNLGTAYHIVGRCDLAVGHFRLAQDLCEEAFGLGTVLVNEAECLSESGHYEAALACFTRALPLLIGNTHAQAQAAIKLAETLRLTGRLAESLEQHEVALRLHQEMGGNQREVIVVLGRLGETLTELGRTAEARQRWAEALLIAERTGDPRAAEVAARITGLEQP
jgi:DNA-binding SARP family transcriptional activator/tetratricopeptide (TPR) repeat protein